MSVRHDVARLLRRVPGVRTALEASDPARRAERLLASGIIDAEFYARQLDLEPMTAAQVAAHYVRVGYLSGATVNPLIDPDRLDAQMMISGRPIIYDYVNARAWGVRTATWWDSVAYLKDHPDSADHPGGPVGHLTARLSRGDTSALIVEGSPAASARWQDLRNALTEASREWSTHVADRHARIPDSAPTHPPTLHNRFPDARTRPLVSIVLPVWNRPVGLRRAVESLAAQTWDDWELLVVDDGSWDDTLVVLDVVAQRDERIRVIRREHEGVCAARNAGIAAAAGDYVAFLDSDNTWQPRFLEDMMTAMTGSGSKVAFASMASRSEGHVLYRGRATDHRRLLTGNTVDLNVLVVARDALRAVGGFDETLRRAVDYDLVLRLAARYPLEHVPTLGADYDNDDDAADRISTTEAYGWNVAVRLRHQHLAATPLRAGVTYLIMTRGSTTVIDESIALARLLAEAEDVQVLLSVTEPLASRWRAARLLGHMHNNVVPLLRGAESFAYLVNSALPLAEFDRLVLVGPDASADAETLRDLAGHADPERRLAIAPVVLTSTGTVEGFGSAIPRPGSPPVRVLNDHPVEDLAVVTGLASVPALTSRVLALPTAHLRDVGGLDPLLYNSLEIEALSADLRASGYEFRIDTTLRAIDRGHPSHLSVDTANNVRALAARTRSFPPDDIDDILGQFGFAMVGIDVPPPAIADDEEDETIHPAPTGHLTAIVTRLRRGERIRWAIKTASPAGPLGETWGDTHFARSLAEALREQGHDVVVDAWDARHRSTAYLDDAVIVLRGLHEYVPAAGQLSYLWVISHPDLVSARELRAFDRVFAASTRWARVMSARLGLSIEPLLQCTDPTRFRPESGRRGDDIVFVGNSRGVPRPVVMESVRSGLPIQVYGSNWEAFIPTSAVKASHIDNRELGVLYASASVVLNDHWADMLREGFISNRLFDAVAAGGRVLSDDAEGIAEIFGGAVRTYRSVSEIVPLLQGDHDELFADEGTLAQISQLIRNEHSFSARAETLAILAARDLGNHE
ncbi:glycosyltransferase [Microbacterium sp. 18062]|uniref:glycosyltransferase n=1 Tax=Microbacterium sp. 18062 TaxID=2681410 RepID=UPI00135B9E86|nr:glycosyltransferase [Microbacterium sp. 18062]